MFGTRSRVLAAARLVADGETTGSATRKRIQPNLVVLVPGPRPEQKKHKAPAAPKPRPRESPRTSKTRPVGPRELVLDWLEELPEFPLQSGDSQTGSQLRERLSAMAQSQPTISALYACMDIDQRSVISSKISYQALVQRPGYRNTLFKNGIRAVRSEEELPDHISKLLERILPEEPLQVCDLDQVKYHRLRNMAIEGTKEEDVGELLNFESLSTVTRNRLDLKRGVNRLLERLRVPNKKPDDKVSTPKPDYHLGYGLSAFPIENLDVLDQLDSSEIKFPFLEIEYKGDGSNSWGRLWVATNQCLGGTATFLNILDQFKTQLNQRSLKTQSEVLESIVFSVVTNGTEARLFVTSSDGQGVFKMFLIRGFLFYEDQGFDKLSAYLTNIIEWGADIRLGHIKTALKALSDSFEAAENLQIENHGSNIGGEREEGSPTPAPQAANTVADRPLTNGQDEQPAQVRGRGRPAKRSQEQVKGKVGRPPKKPRPA
ncbi:unnamed protein product [Clonostachys rhizophaga]|uniref:DUF7924 domain-containing protein n=1 Tax=Clonostachys rhizophaga TaxID=160324 RepID=A0A9N9YBU1_9HYPO|nr:unnamed protein product [Clonostachys rhizophaga]